MNRAAVALLSVGAVGLLAACGAPANRNTAKMTPAEARVAADSALSDAALSGALTGDPYSLTAQGVRALGVPAPAVSALEAAGMDLPQAISAGCKIDIGSWVDKDSDFIPVGFTISVSACSYTDTGSGFSYSFEGVLKLDDNNDGLANSGFTLAFQGFKEKASKGTDSLERTFDGSYALDAQTKTLYKVDKGYTATQALTSSGQTDSTSVQYSVAETYAPDSVAQPKKAGTYEVSQGKPGSFSITRNGRAYVWTGYTDPNLKFDASCKARTAKGVRIPFTSGAAVYTYTNPDGAASTLRIAFSACGQYTVTLDGQAL